MDSYTVNVQSKGPKPQKFYYFAHGKSFRPSTSKKKEKFEFFVFGQNHLILDRLREKSYKWPK